MYCTIAVVLGTTALQKITLLLHSGIVVKKYFYATKVKKNFKLLYICIMVLETKLQKKVYIRK